MQMEDKGMLEHKVEALKQKLESVERFDDMLEATHKLQLQQDEQVKLQDRLKEQKAQLLQAEHRLNTIGQQLQQKRAERSGSQRSSSSCVILRPKWASLRNRRSTLPQQLQEKQRRMEELQHVLSENTTSEGEQRLQQQHQQISRNVQQLER